MFVEVGRAISSTMLYFTDIIPFYITYISSILHKLYAELSGKSKFSKGFVYNQESMELWRKAT